jgi:hypothetical protein
MNILFTTRNRTSKTRMQPCSSARNIYSIQFSTMKLMSNCTLNMMFFLYFAVQQNIDNSAHWTNGASFLITFEGTGGCYIHLMNDFWETLQICKIQYMCWLQDQFSNQELKGMVLPNAAFAYVLLSLYRPDYRDKIYL